MGESSVRKKEKTMTPSSPLCSECKQAMVLGTTDFLYADDGIQVTVPQVPAWVCGNGHEPLFSPETTDQLTQTVRELAAAARRAQHRKPVFHEYLVKVA